jgi:hypothetical protein
MKKRFSRKVDTFMVNTTLKMYNMLEDYTNNSVIVGGDLINALEDNVDYNDPELFFYCVIDRTYMNVEDLIMFCLDAESDTEYEFEITWKKDIAWVERIRDTKIASLLA